MPLGEYTVTLRVTGSFRDARDAADTVKSLAQDALARELASWRREADQRGARGYGPDQHTIRKIDNIT